MRFLPSLQTKHADSTGAIARATGNTTSAGSYSSLVTGGGMRSWDIDQAVQRGYERVIAVFRCVDAISHAVSSIELIFRQDNDKTGRRVIDDQLTYVLNKRANTYETAAQFRYRLSSQLLLSRKGAFIERINNRAGRPAQLHLLNPQHVTEIRDSRTYVSGYKVRGSDNKQYTLDPDQVLWIKLKPHPTDPYLQMTPIMAAGLAVDTDYLSRLFNRNFIANDGRPGTLISVQGQMNPEDAEELKRRFNGGPGMAGRTSVIESDGITVADLAATPHDLQFLQGLTAAKEDLLLAFGTPESVLGNASGRTFDNADAERLNWYMDTIVPHGDAVGSSMDSLTVDREDDRIYVTHNWDEVDVLQRAKQMREDRFLNEFKQGVRTLDSYLEAVGRAPLNVPGTQVLWIPAGMVPIGKNDDVTRAAQALVPVAAAPMPGAMGPDAAAGDASQQMPAQDDGNYSQAPLPGFTPQQRAIANDSASRAGSIASRAEKALQARQDIIDAEIVETKVFDLDAPDPYAMSRLSTESELTGILSSWDRRQDIVIAERLNGTKARRGTRHWQYAEGEIKGTKALDADYVANPRRWAEEVRADFEPVLRRVVTQQAKRVTRELQRKGANIVTPNGDEVLNDVLAIVETSAHRQSQRLAEKIAKMDADGASMTDIKKTVRSMIGARSTWKKSLIRMATTSVIEGTKTEAFDQLPSRQVVRTWMSHKDERTRHTHKAASGQQVKGAQWYRVGAAQLRFPCDPTGPAAEVANCRCWQEVQVTM